ncbi:MAG: 3-isopropylmalate dehydratase [Omnitrophica WOR_2 bacterium RIFCSPLOWO2_12_FULL_46_30]|nr:MAG: 3-isopropylmalate dehydratase [Omnitrophica WOR_2 bacterium RIFCSPHIGHO2_02_FULL_46_37]OGX50242.1 MAG: 3-isopropylmalate dehydratase [Omnitrophica WOR_2 bacterium RIFCSPLOWO2_12_FULL_46_30]
MRIKGRAVLLGDNINTDFIISGRYKFSITDMKELSKHIMEDIDPEFPKKLKKGESILVAGENFGMGSSREQAPLVIKESGIVAVVARSFARIFYRNGFNIGLPLIQADTSKIKERDELEIDFDRSRLEDRTQNLKINIQPLSAIMQKLLDDGGIVNHLKKHHGRLRL